MSNFYQLKAAATKAELALQTSRNKAHSEELAPSTRRGYSRKLPQAQKALLDARQALNEFVDEQREIRGLKPREYDIKRIRRN